MIISLNWLKSYIPSLDAEAEEIAAILTDIGLEVESIEEFESVKGGLKGLVIGYVAEKEKHPDADKLSITRVSVDNSGTLHQVVCGAPNVAKGQKVIVALPGTTIHPSEGESFKIKLSKIRGVESAGMICAEDEIGLGSSHDGIMILPEDAPVGMLASDYFNVSADKVIHIGLTPNRIDAASHLGVARDLVAALRQRQKTSHSLQFPQLHEKIEGKASVSVKIENENDCKTYLALEVTGVKVGPSPSWLKKNIEAIGVRSINNIVDITNFVMHECGQPLHAFDAAKIGGNQLVVRRAKADEKFVTLDGIERKLNVNDLVIADQEKPMCLAGVFGGLHSGVTNETTAIVLESAWFNPVVVRKTARAHELHTDSSFRFERGADPMKTEWAMLRAAQLMVDIAGGKINGLTRIEHPFAKVNIEFSPAGLNAFTGQEIPANEIESILTSLDFKIESKGDIWKLEAPLYRVDVTRAVDVYEEVLRIYGYNNIAIPSKVNASPQLSAEPDPERLVETISAFLASKGLTEIMNNSLNAGRTNELNKNENSGDIKLLNPLSSELDVLRNSLLYGGLQSVAYNINRQQHNMAFFEIGSVYTKVANGYHEEQQIGIWYTGKKTNAHWQGTATDATYYTLKGITQSLTDRFVKTKLDSKNGFEHNYLVDVFGIYMNNAAILQGGAVKPEVLKHFDIDQPVYFAEITLRNLIEAIKRTRFKYQEVSKFPVIKRDLSLLLNADVEFAALQQAVLQTNKQLIRSVDVFDVYTGKNMEAGKKSYAISLTIANDEKTMKDEEVESLMQKVMKNITEKTGAVLR
ncbi:MAG TPA: phenylalanine--tRNA ligase subunit beta [Flavobacteriales bacterium]|nr:phenylalanine--tRNA ligase subunit beta [Flavobacteriales bacterium]